MEELSIEEKARNYDEAYKKVAVRFGSNVADEIFLKESEDERIRKALIKLVKKAGEGYENVVNGVSIENAISWLEKQGEQDLEWSKEENDKLSTIIAWIKDYPRLAKFNEEAFVRANNYAEWLKSIRNKYVQIKNTGQKSADTDFSDLRTWKYIVDAVLTEKEGIGQYLDSPFTEEVAKKLQKRFGNIEQKPADKIQLGKKYRCIASPRYSTFMTGETYKPEDKFLCSLMNFCSDCFEPVEDCEQKSADTPKFKIGDYIISNNNSEIIYHITGTGINELGSPDYVCEHVGREKEYNGRIYNMRQDKVDANFRLWTIQDAKDGDVLSYRDGQWIFIYKGIVTENTFKYYALLSEKGITVNDAAFNLLSSCITPATKEQRDTLLKAMTDAGYTFDFEKKELKKIQQQPTEWSKENETIAKALTKAANDNVLYGYIGKSKLLEWLKSLKDRYTWRPSDEQMKALSIAMQGVNDHLFSLYQDLKKLKE